MVEILKVFVGAITNETGRVCAADTDELLSMGKRAQEKGFVIGHSLTHTFETIRAQTPKTVIVHGGLTGDCVAKAVSCAIEAGAQTVTIPLAECRFSTQDHGRHSQDQREVGLRLISLKKRLGRLAEDPRVKIVCPIEIK